MNSLILFLITLGLDRFTKAWALKTLAVTTQSPCFFMNLVLAWNKGISWSFFASDSEWGFYLLTTIICLVIILFAWHSIVRACQYQAVWCEGLVLGGALSNLIDRFFYGAVIDFIELHLGGYSFPVFNIADVAIFIGVAGMLLRSWQVERRGCSKKNV